MQVLPQCWNLTLAGFGSAYRSLNISEPDRLVASDSQYRGPDYADKNKKQKIHAGIKTDVKQCMGLEIFHTVPFLASC